MAKASPAQRTANKETDWNGERRGTTVRSECARFYELSLMRNSEVTSGSDTRLDRSVLCGPWRFALAPGGWFLKPCAIFVLIDHRCCSRGEPRPVPGLAGRALRWPAA